MKLNREDMEDIAYKPLILAVDDSPDILTAISSILSNEYRVFKLPKPTMIAEVLQQVKPDLFLLDYQMPELNGFDLIPIIRSYEAHKETPIVFLTSEGTLDHVTAAVGLGACDFMVKPFDRKILREKIAKNLKPRKQFNQSKQFKQ
jgi:putative two-component system response regulator